MDMHTSDQDLRREAIRRRLSGERRKEICNDLDRSTSWFDKWWAVYQQNPRIDFAGRSRAPHGSPTQTPDTVVHTVVSIRQTLEAAATPETRYGFIGSPAIQNQLESLGIEPPSETTIQRILRAHGLTHPIGAGGDSAYYPWLDARAVNAIKVRRSPAITGEHLRATWSKLGLPQI